MLIEVGIENFRSIKDRIELSLIADSGNSKKDNLSEVILPNEKSIRLLNTLAIYGANASGKSNVIRGLFSLVWFIKTSGQLTAEKGIPYYDPFLFDTKIGDHPTIFCITFLLEEIKYRYQVSYNSQAVLHEQLDYYPKGQKQNLFTRSFTPDTIQQVGRLSNQFNYKEFELFSNQLFLSKFGRDIPNEIISKVYLYFTKLEIWNACSTIKLNQLQKNMKLYYKDPHNSLLLKKLNNLIRSADTMIRSIKIESVPDKGQDESNKNDDSVPNLDIRSYHDLFEGEKHIGFRDISFENESVGTNALLAFGGLVLIALEFGGVVMIDEIHNSLHTKTIIISNRSYLIIL